MIDMNFELKKYYTISSDKKNFIFPLKYKDKTPDEFWVIDTEDNSKGIIKLAVIKSNTGKRKVFQRKYYKTLRKEIQEFIWSIPRSSESPTIIYAHNLGYDAGNIWGSSFLKYDCLFRHTLLLELKLNDDVILKDSYAILASSVEKIGEQLGFKKLPAIKGFINVEYCERDIDIILKALTSLFANLEKNKIPLQLTLPSMFHAYFKTTLTKSRESKGRVGIIRRNPDYLEFARKSYKGGRCEAIKMGVFKNVNVYDINSLYPYVMSIANFPNPNSASRGIEIVNSKDIFQICKVIIRQDNYLPVLSEKISVGSAKSRDTKLIFPNGTCIGYFTNHEIEYMTKNGYGEVVEVIETLNFNYMGSIFKTVINDLFNLRMNTKTKFESYIYKIIMNGGYGKYAQSNIVIEFDGKFLIEIEKDYYPRQSNYIWSSHITALARIHLHKFMQRYSKYLLYVDTDSIHLWKHKIAKKYLGDKLGQFKFEGNFKEAEYKGAKFYRLDNQYKVKGVPVEQIIDGKKVQLSKQYFENGIAIYNKPVKLKSALRFGRVLNNWEQVEKKIRGDYNKRVIMTNEIETIPNVSRYSKQFQENILELH